MRGEQESKHSIRFNDVVGACAKPVFIWEINVRLRLLLHFVAGRDPEHIAVEMDGATLVFGFREHLSELDYRQIIQIKSRIDISGLLKGNLKPCIIKRVAHHLFGYDIVISSEYSPSRIGGARIVIEKPHFPLIPGDFDELLRQHDLLRQENAHLKHLLDVHGISYDAKREHINLTEPQEVGVQTDSSLTDLTPANDQITKRSPMSEKIALFLSLFRGRDDVYARQWKNKEGKIGYSPVCRNEWVSGVCVKPKAKCVDCTHASYLRYDESAIQFHLSGSQVLGIYPLQVDDQCAFLAIDFDEDSWKQDVCAVASVCKRHEVPYAVEISRSGNGAHLWFFFSASLEASLARNFGSLLLTLAMRENARLSFSSYDRMFPNQDNMPKGGFGNLIALPFQKSAYQNGGSIFVDNELKPFADQWAFLSSIQRIHRTQLETWIAQWHTPPLGELRRDDDSDESKPWQRSNANMLTFAEFPADMRCITADRLYIPVGGLSQGSQNLLKRLAAFRNPQFYQAQAMRMPIWNKPRVICCADYEGDYLCLPRGCADDLNTLALEHHFRIMWQDERSPGRRIDTSFIGILREDQQAALDVLSAYDNGVLSATTAFGKTVVGAAMIAKKHTNTLILVHRRQLMEQWQERLACFLDIQEVLPEPIKKRGRKKKRSVIGLYGAGKDTRSGIVDIAMMQSLGNGEEIKDWLGDYGMVIVDECHHVPAVSFEQVLKRVRSKYVYGLTATPTRQDGHHPILVMYLGAIRYRVDAKEQAHKRPFDHIMIPCFTGSTFHIQQEEKTPAIGQYYAQIIEDDLRNHQIIDDVLACIKENRNCLLLSERTRHVKELAAMLADRGQSAMTLLGGKTSVETAKQLSAIRNAPRDRPLVICATGKYIGEGFDEPRLDTLFLTMPISWHGTLAQYAGRIHRLHEGKREVRVYDYIDTSSEMLERMYHKRLKGYASIGYHVSSQGETSGCHGDLIYDQNTFQKRFIDDVCAAKKSVQIVSPYVTVKRIRWVKDALLALREKGISVTILTRPTTAFSGKSAEAARTAIQELESIGVHMQLKPAIHQKYAIIDGTIVWYGSINLLSFGSSQESVMRLVSGSVARALLREPKTQLE